MSGFEYFETPFTIFSAFLMKRSTLFALLDMRSILGHDEQISFKWFSSAAAI